MNYNSSIVFKFMQMISSVESQWESGWEREREGVSLPKGACLPVMRHEIDLHTWNNLKALTCCAPNSTELNWTLAVPQQTRIRPKDTQRYTKIQKDTKIHRCSYKWVRCEALQSVVCLMVDLLDLSPHLLLSLSIWIQDLRICLIQSCLSSRLLSVWAANHACNMPPRYKIKDEFTLS